MLAVASRDHTINLPLNLISRRRPINDLFQHRKLIMLTDHQAADGSCVISNGI